MTTSTSPSSRVTLKDVAARAGVGAMSASVVLNGGAENVRVSPDTRQRILEAAQELGYKRNGSASQLKTGRFGSATLVLSTRPYHSSLLDGVLEAVHDELSANGLHLNIVRLPDDKLTDAEFVPHMLRQWNSDGLLLDYTHDVPAPLVALVERHRIPSVWMNVWREHDCARPDDEGAGRIATERLLDMGHRHVLYVTNSLNRKEHYSIAARRRGHEAALHAAGLAPSIFEANIEEAAQTFAKAQVLLAGSERPTAIMGYDPRHVLPFWQAAAIQRLSVPDELSLISFGPSLVEAFGQTFTQWRVPTQAMSRAAVQLLLHKIAQPDDLLPTRLIPFELQPGHTCAPPQM